MAFPARSRGLRSITVNEVQFRWRFSPSESDSVLVVYGPSTGRQALKIHLGPWLECMGLYFPNPISQLPSVIVPDFVRQSIKFGLTQGWAHGAKAKDFEVEWREGGFHHTPWPPPGQVDDSRSTSSA